MTQIAYEETWQKEPFKVNGVQIVTATHPDWPNRSGNARGRKCHMVDDSGRFAKRRGHFTRCGLLVDDLMRKGDMVHTVFSGRWCKQCFGGEAILADAIVACLKKENQR